MMDRLMIVLTVSIKRKMYLIKEVKARNGCVKGD
jgi:hypothetical protein